YPVLLGWALHRKIPAHGCAPGSRLPVADRESLLRRCKNWLPAPKQKARLATLARSWRRTPGLLPRPSPRTFSPRSCGSGAAPHPDVAAIVDSARKTSCSVIPRDAPAGILPTLTATSMAMLLQLLINRLP